MKSKKPLPYRILISGIAGTGKDATAEGLAEQLNQNGNHVEYVSVGTHVFRRLAKEAGMDIVAYGKFLTEHPENEKKLDVASLELLNQHMNCEGPGIIITSRVLPFLVTQPEVYPVKFPEKILRIRFDCGDDHERLTRINRRDFRKKYGKDPSPLHLGRLREKTRQTDHEREHTNDLRYKNLYGTGHVLADKYFHEVVDSRGMSLQQQVEVTFDVLLRYQHIFE